MNRLKLLLRSLAYQRYSHCAVMCGVAVGCTVLTGALLVGDSMDYTLRWVAHKRLGGVESVLLAQNRYFRQSLADDLNRKASLTAAPVLQLNGSITGMKENLRANQIKVLGVDSAYWSFAGKPPAAFQGVAVNRKLAEKLKISPGDEVILRVEKTSLLPRDAPLSTIEDLSVAHRAKVIEIISDESLGSFSLEASQVLPANVFIPIEKLQELVNLQGQANLMLLRENLPKPADSKSLFSRIRECLQLADYGLELHTLSNRKELELRTRRIFLDPPVLEAARKTGQPFTQILTYFVNEIRKGDHSAPYSIVASMDPIPGGIEPPLSRDEILLNQWLADDLGAQAGDSVETAYFVLGPMRHLIEHRRTFRVRQIVPVEGNWLDPDLMPDFPGMVGSENCRDWEPGFSIDVSRIRDKDEAYWDHFRGSPKAFVSLQAGQEMWSNRFGSLTALRFPGAHSSIAELSISLFKHLEPEKMGLSLRPVQEEARQSTDEAQDFSQLFLGFSFFLIVSALLLIALLHRFSIEQRGSQIGLIRAVGLSRSFVLSWLSWEGMVISFIGVIAGVAFGLLFAQGILYALASIWSGAVGSETQILFHAPLATLFKGAGISLFLSEFVILLVARKLSQKPPKELLARAGIESSLGYFRPRRPMSLPVGMALLAVAIISLFLTPADSSGAFFGLGGLLLLAILLIFNGCLRRSAPSTNRPVLSLFTLGFGNTRRRPGRSVAVAAILSAGVFMIVAVGANRKNPNDNPYLRSTGTGGFPLVGTTSLPVLQDLNSEEGLNTFALSKGDLPGVSFVPFKVRDGEDASCLNLNRAHTPMLMGVDPHLLDQRKAFSFSGVIEGENIQEPWLLLDKGKDLGILPGIADQATLVWGLHKKLGDTLTYIDEQGRPFEVRIVATLAASILQGRILISDKNFQQKFPSESGYRFMLVDCPAQSLAAVQMALSQALADIGLDLSLSRERLAEYLAVENTYLSIFQVLGGLGLILGSMGLGLLVLRNVLDRQGELALLRAVGYSRKKVRSLIFQEHCLLFLVGVGSGCLAGGLAIYPHITHNIGDLPWLSLGLTLLALLVNGLAWIGGATLLALRGPLLSSLSRE